MHYLEGTWRCSWLRHCATSRKDAGSIPNGVIGILHWHNPSSLTMALGSTQRLTEMSTRNISWGVKAAGAYGWQPYHLYGPLSWNMVASTSWNPQGLSRPVMGLLYLYLCTTCTVQNTTIKFCNSWSIGCRCLAFTVTENYKLTARSSLILQKLKHAQLTTKILLNLNVHYHTKNSPLHIPFLSQINPV